MILTLKPYKEKNHRPISLKCRWRNNPQQNTNKHELSNYHIREELQIKTSKVYFWNARLVQSFF